jgi:filamentous hemagglutinin family protein
VNRNKGVFDFYSCYCHPNLVSISSSMKLCPVQMQLGLNAILCFSIVGAIASSKCALAQSVIAPDNTLGSERSRIIQNFQGLPIEVIAGGAVRGQNLFHSFAEFNVSEGRGAYFFSPSTAVQNILARVTGNNSSQILGVLGTVGNSQPNLFLINPNGIIFGRNASLDVGGSFYATTANAIQFGDRGFFSATKAEVPALLTIQPSAFLFNQVNPGAIINRSFTFSGLDPANGIGFGLQVLNRQNLVLLGGNITIDGGALTNRGGQVEIGAVGSVGTVELSSTGSLTFPDSLLRADVTFKNQAFIDVRAGGGGAIRVQARNIDLSGASLIQAGIIGFQPTPARQAGDIVLNATGTLHLTEQSTIDNSVFSSSFFFPSGSGNSGNIRITTGSLIATSGSRIINNTGGQGNAGSTVIQARDRVFLDGVGSSIQQTTSGIFSDVEAGGKGSGGAIEITTGALSLTQNAQLSTSTYGQGDAGTISIDAREVFLDRMNSTGNLTNGIFSTVEPGAIGRGGNIKITTNTLFLGNASLITAFTGGKGDAGNIRINARDRISIVGTGTPKLSVFTVVQPGGIGQGGNIDLNTDTLSITNGAQLQTSTGGQGNAGDIAVNARTISFSGGAVESKVIPGGVGNGGNITLTMDSLSLTNGGQIEASTFGQGNAGNIVIKARDQIFLDGFNPIYTGASSGIFSSVGQTDKSYENVTGNGGDISITTGSLVATNGAQIQTEVANGAHGNAGDVTINARDRVIFDGTTGIKDSRGAIGYSAIYSGLTGTNTVGKGGNIEVTAGSLQLSHQAFLKTATEGQGDAGNVTIHVRDRIFLNDAFIFSGAAAGSVGKGGDITLTTNSLFLNQSSLIANTLGQGNAGNITLSVDQHFVAVDGSVLTSALQSSGGAIRITSGEIALFGNSDIRTNVAEGRGGAGNIALAANSILALSDSDILAFARDGQGGNITLDTPAFFGQNYRPAPSGTDPFTLDGNDRVDINASGTIAGIVSLPDITFIQNSLTKLATNPIDTSMLLANSCIVRGDRQSGRFLITGPGGLPDRPDNASTSLFPTGEVRSVVEDRESTKTQNLGSKIQTSSERPWKIGDPIAEPQGVYQLSNGELVMSRECAE